MVVYTLRPRQNRRQFADDTYKCIFLNENVWIPIRISLKFVPKGPINNMPALVQIMAWRRSGDKPLSGPMWLDYRRIYASIGLNELILKTYMYINQLWTLITKILYMIFMYLTYYAYTVYNIHVYTLDLATLLLISYRWTCLNFVTCSRRLFQILEAW